MVPVRNLETSKPATDLLEQRHGYHYWPYKTEVMHWLCKPSEHVRTHHLHIVPIDSPLWRERLMFRDALREDSDMRDRYSELKRRLAQAHSSDREAYTVGKTPFVAWLVAAVPDELGEKLAGAELHVIRAEYHGAYPTIAIRYEALDAPDLGPLVEEAITVDGFDLGSPLPEQFDV